MDKTIKRMIDMAVDSLKNSYAPYSNFHVAACIRSDSNEFYVGNNVENSSYGLTICAESSAICKMINAGDKIIKEIVVLAQSNNLCSPCGACRQRIFEFSNDNTKVHMCNKNDIIQTMSINELLPLAFKFNPQSGN